MQADRNKLIVAGLIFTGAGLLLAFSLFNIELSDSIFTGGCLVFAVAILLAFVSTKREIPQSETHGSAEWATDNDLKKLLADYDDPPAPGSIILGRSPSGKYRLDLPLDTMLCHGAVIGPTGIGKGRGFFLWALAHFKGSFVYSDPKSEGWKETSGYLEKAGYKAWRFAPTDPLNSLHFNWIPACGHNPTLCYLLALAVVTARYPGADKFFIENQTIIVASLFAHASTFENPTPASLYKFICSFKGEEFLAQVLQSTNEHARGFATIFCSASEKLRGNILMGAASTLNFLADSRVQQFTSASAEPPEFHRLRKEIIGVYWCLEEGDVSALKPLSTLFFTLCFYQLKEERLDFSYSSIREVIEAGKENPYLKKFVRSELAGYLKKYASQQFNRLAALIKTAKLPAVLPVSLLIDEVGNIGPIPGLATEIGVIRGRGIGFFFGIQTRPQLPSVYGKDEGEIILNNCNTKIFLGALDPDTCEWVSKALGDTTVVEEDISISEKRSGIFSKDVTKTTRISKVKRRLLTAEEVRQIAETRQIIISRNLKPIICDRFWYTAVGGPATANKLGPALIEDFSTATSNSRPQANGTQNNGGRQSQNQSATQPTATLLVTVPMTGKLTIEPIPASSPVQQLRKAIDNDTWEKLKIRATKEAKNKCRVCNRRGEDSPLKCYESWSFDDTRHIQKLLGMIMLCADCYEVKNLIAALKNNKAAKQAAYLGQINGWSNQQTILYIKNVYALSEQRGKFTNWTIDLSYLAQATEQKTANVESW